jgi:endonuclease-3
LKDRLSEMMTPDDIMTGLRSRFGIPHPPQKRDPIDELILTILSQNTNDRNRDRAFTALKARCPDMRQVLHLTGEELARIIEPAGLGPTKSRRIHDLLSRLYGGGRKGLPDLCSMDPDEGMRYLTGFKGIGPKTASCVLLFSCGLPAFPVDTHIFRTGMRLGLLPPKADRVKAHAVLAGFFAPEHYLELHLNLIRLGREICRPGRPDCGRCPLAHGCPSSETVDAKGGRND